MAETKAELKKLRLDLPEGGFELESGERLAELEFAYEAYGPLAADRRNVVFVCHALTGDAHAAFRGDGTESKPGWWDGLIGPGKGIDTERFHVICVNVLGGCQGTTGPRSKNPATGRPYGADFPFISIADTVAAEKLFLDQLGIPELYAVIGGSMGGMRALQWTISAPRFVKRCICVAAAASLSPQALAFDIIGRQAIESDPAWNEGACTAAGEQPVQGLSRARQIGHVTYLSSASMAAKFGRDQRAASDSKSDGASKFRSNFEVESYLNHQGRKFVARFDANSYLYLCRMVDLFDLAAEHGSLRTAFASCSSRFLIIGISTDWLFPVSQQMELVSALLAERKDVSYFRIDSDYGHDAFLVEYETLNRGVSAFLEGSEPAAPPTQVNRLDVDDISYMLDEGIHVLDVGSGDGDTMLALKQRRQVTGVCLDVSFAAVTACLRRGQSALHLDADTGLGIIPDAAFDCVLLNQTIQQLHSPLQSLKQMLRIAPAAIVGFPNFAYCAYRLGLLVGGRLPTSETLPYEWYDTPNIHVITVHDFRNLCRRNNVCVEAIEFISESAIGSLLTACGLPNLGAERVVVRIARATPGCCEDAGWAEACRRRGRPGSATACPC